MSVSSKPGTELHCDGSKISLTMGSHPTAATLVLPNVANG
jgi:hypothetical protein